MSDETAEPREVEADDGDHYGLFCLLGLGCLFGECIRYPREEPAS